MWDQLVELIRHQLENQFLAGGVVMVVIASIWSLIKDLPKSVWSLVKRRVITTVDLADHDLSFYWVQKWLDTHPYTKKARLLTVSTRQRPGDAPSQPIDPDTKNPIEVLFSPAPGKHFLFYKKQLIVLTRERTKDATGFGSLAFRETLTLQSLSKTAIQALIYEARSISVPAGDQKINLLRPNWENWKIVQRRTPRPLETVVTDGTIAEDLLKDIEWFSGAFDWYAERGIPYQRGYLLEGPPGNGKTSLIVALASTLKKDIHMINLAWMNDGSLSNAMASLPEKAIVIIEDIDGCFTQRQSNVKELSFSGFINAIDGASSPSGRILFVTTNHVERLDPALIRPGRMDRPIFIGNASPDQARRMFLRFFPSCEDQARKFESLISEADHEYSMASLQEHLIKYRNDVDEAATLPVYAPSSVIDPAPVISLVKPDEDSNLKKASC